MSDTFMIGNSSVNSASYVCEKCGTLCSSDKLHLCPIGSGIAPTKIYNAISPIFSVDTETKLLLERIATALEKLAGTGL